MAAVCTSSLAKWWLVVSILVSISQTATSTRHESLTVQRSGLRLQTERMNFCALEFGHWGHAQAEILNFPTTALTVEFWVKNELVSGQGTPFSFATATEDNEFVIYNINDLRLAVKNEHVRLGLKADRQWHHVAITWRSSGGQVTAYWDGVQAFVGNTKSDVQLASAGTLVLGEEQDTRGGGFSKNQALFGMMRDVRVYDIHRGAADIQADFRDELTGKEAGLALYWKLDDCTGATVSDDSHHNNDAKLYSALASKWFHLNPSDIDELGLTKPRVTTSGGVPDARRTSWGGPGSNGGMALLATSIKIVAKDKDGNPACGESSKWEAKIVSNTDSIAATIGTCNAFDGSFDITYSPRKVGQYEFTLRYDGATVVTLHLKVKEGPMDPSKSHVHGKALTKARSGEKATFVIASMDAAGNPSCGSSRYVAALVSGLAVVPVNIGVCNPATGEAVGSYIANKVGDYELTLKYDGQPIEVAHPTVTGGQLDPKKTLITGAALTTAQSGTEMTFTILGRDSAVNPSCGNTKDWSGEMSGPSPVPILFGDCHEKDGSVEVSYTAGLAGRYELRLKYLGDIVGVYRPLVSSGGVDPRRSGLVGPGVTGGLAGETLKFTILAVDAAGNPSCGSKAKWLVTIQGPSHPSVTLGACESSTGKIEAMYVPFAVGKYDLSVKYGETVVQSALPVIIPGTLDVKSSLTEGKGIEKTMVGVPTTFRLIGKDKYGNPTCGDVTKWGAAMKGPAIVTVDTGQCDESRMTIEMSYTAEKSGEYELLLSYDGTVVGKWTPTVEAGLVDPQKCQAIGAGLGTGRVGESMQFAIVCLDSFGNPTCHKQTSFVVDINGPTPIGADQERCIPSKGATAVTFVPTKSGTYDVTIKYGSQPLGNGKVFHPSISSGLVVPSMYKVSGSGLNGGRAGVLQTITITSTDKGGNPACDPEKHWTAKLVGPESVLIDAEPCNPNYGATVMKFTPLVAGTYNLIISFGGFVISNGKKNQIRIEPDFVDPQQSTAVGEGLVKGHEGENVSFLVKGADKFGNPSCGKAQKWTATVQWVGVSTRTGEDYVQTPFSNSGLSVLDRPSLHPAMCPLPPPPNPIVKTSGCNAYDNSIKMSYTASRMGVYKLEIFYEGQVIGDKRGWSPIVYPGLPEPSKCSATGSGLVGGSQDMLLGFIVHSRTASGNPACGDPASWGVSMTGSSNVIVDHSGCNALNGTIVFTYTARTKGVFRLVIYYNNVAIAGGQVWHPVIRPAMTTLKTFAWEEAPYLMNYVGMPERMDQATMDGDSGVRLRSSLMQGERRGLGTSQEFTLDSGRVEVHFTVHEPSRSGRADGCGKMGLKQANSGLVFEFWVINVHTKAFVYVGAYERTEDDAREIRVDSTWGTCTKTVQQNAWRYGETYGLAVIFSEDGSGVKVGLSNCFDGRPCELPLHRPAPTGRGSLLTANSNLRTHSPGKVACAACSSGGHEFGSFKIALSQYNSDFVGIPNQADASATRIIVSGEGISQQSPEVQKCSSPSPLCTMLSPSPSVFSTPIVVSSD